MDRIQVACPSCPAMLSLPAGRAGPVECPKCQSTFTADTRKKGRIDDDEEWRDRLLRALDETGARRPPPKARSLYAKLILRIVAVTLVFLPVLWGIDTLNDASAKDLSTPWQFRIDFWLLSSVIVLSIITSALGVPIIRLRRQIRAVGAEKALQSATNRPILYLRSFNVDELSGRQTLLDHLFRGNFYSDSLGPEDQLTRRFSKLGPMIAIGRPGEELPSLGAARFYVSNDKWQEKVADIAREAQFIVWVSGTTGGLHWELNHLIQTVAPSKLIVWAHPHLMRLSAPKREREWRSFLERLGKYLPGPAALSPRRDQIILLRTDVCTSTSQTERICAAAAASRRAPKSLRG
jgi:LSD1 subclass zinc finger protein